MGVGVGCAVLAREEPDQEQDHENAREQEEEAGRKEE